MRIAMVLVYAIGRVSLYANGSQLSSVLGVVARLRLVSASLLAVSKQL